MALTSRQLRGSARLDEAAANRKRALLPGESGEAVAKLQRGLMDYFGQNMPITVRKNGTADGIYGQETVQWVMSFQTQSGLKNDGLAGPDTLGRLDTLLDRGHPAPVQPVGPFGPDVPDSPFKQGVTDPPYFPDAGAGPWGSKPATLEMQTKKALIQNNAGALTLIAGVDATKHMLHYLGNSGSDLTIDFRGMVNDVQTVGDEMTGTIMDAQAFCEQLQPGSYFIISKATTPRMVHKWQSENWFLAVGGYHTWGKGKVVVEDRGSGRGYRMDFEYKFRDRYNWDDNEKKVTILGQEIHNRDVGEFHREGIAKEFDMFGSVTKLVEWTT